MGPVFVTRAVAADVGPLAELIAAHESSLYGRSAYSQADLVDEWSDVDLERNARVVRMGGRIVGYGAVRERGEVWDAEGYVHPDALGRGIGKLIATGSSSTRRVAAHAESIAGSLRPTPRAADCLSRSVTAPCACSVSCASSLRRRRAHRSGRAGFRIVAFDSERDAREFHAAEEEAFADHWDYTPHAFERWSKEHLGSERFDATLWCVVRAGDELAAGIICTGDTYGGGWVQALFTRPPWRKKGVATALLRESFRRFWERGEHSIGLAVDTANPTGAFRLYESAGMAPTLGLVIYEKRLSNSEERSTGDADGCG